MNEELKQNLETLEPCCDQFDRNWPHIINVTSVCVSEYSSTLSTDTKLVSSSLVIRIIQFQLISDL